MLRGKLPPWRCAGAWLMIFAMSFYDQPILNSPYGVPTRHHALDDDGQPLDLPAVDGRRRSKLITPVPRAKKRGKKVEQTSFVLPDAADQSKAEHH